MLKPNDRVQIKNVSYYGKHAGKVGFVEEVLKDGEPRVFVQIPNPHTQTGFDIELCNSSDLQKVEEP